MQCSLGLSQVTGALVSPQKDEPRVLELAGCKRRVLTQGPSMLWNHPSLGRPHWTRSS